MDIFKNYLTKFNSSTSTAARAALLIFVKFDFPREFIIRTMIILLDIQDDVYTFIWDGAEEKADMIDDIEEERVKFKWQDADDEDEYLEFRMYKSNITNETILELTDYCDDDEVEEQKDLWNKQMNQLRVEVGG